MTYQKFFGILFQLLLVEIYRDLKDMSDRRLTKRRKHLWKENPNCFFCGIETILPHVAALKYDVPLSRIGKLPKNILNRIATIDHEFCRFEPERLQNHNRPTTRLACFACNSKEGMRRFKALPASFRRAWTRGLGEFRRFAFRHDFVRASKTTLGDALGPEQLKFLYAHLNGNGNGTQSLWHKLTWWLPKHIRKLVGGFLFVTILRQDKKSTEYDRIHHMRKA